MQVAHCAGTMVSNNLTARDPAQDAGIVWSFRRGTTESSIRLDGRLTISVNECPPRRVSLRSDDDIGSVVILGGIGRVMLSGTRLFLVAHPCGKPVSRLDLAQAVQWPQQHLPTSPVACQN